MNTLFSPRVLLSLFGAAVLFAAPAVLAKESSDQPAQKKPPDSAPSAKSAQATEQQPVVKMQPFQVTEKQPKLSFGMALSVWTNSVTKQITAIYVTRVKPGSDAGKVGIGPYTRIERIDGKAVEDMKPAFGYGTELNKAFVNRKTGDKLTLTVVLPGSTSPITVCLVNHDRNPTEVDFLFGRR